MVLLAPLLLALFSSLVLAAIGLTADAFLEKVKQNEKISSIISSVLLIPFLEKVLMAVGAIEASPELYNQIQTLSRVLRTVAIATGMLLLAAMILSAWFFYSFFLSLLKIVLFILTLAALYFLFHLKR